MIRCAHCGLRLNADGHCPADLAELPRYEGREYGTDRQLAHRLGIDVTPGMIRQWRKRKGLANHGGLSYYDEASTIERDIRMRKDRRGRSRRLDLAAA